MAAGVETAPKVILATTAGRWRTLHQAGSLNNCLHEGHSIPLFFYQPCYTTKTKPVLGLSQYTLGGRPVTAASSPPSRVGPTSPFGLLLQVHEKGLVHQSPPQQKAPINQSSQNDAKLGPVDSGTWHINTQQSTEQRLARIHCHQCLQAGLVSRLLVRLRGGGGGARFLYHFSAEDFPNGDR